MTKISGRGVGMDVVQRFISEMGGTVLIESEKGVGTSFKITLPTTLSIVESIIVKVGGENYAVPIPDLLEIIDLREYTVTPGLDGHKVVDFRNTPLPIMNLSQLLKGTNYSEGLKDEHIVLIGQYQHKKIGYIVEKIIGQQQVAIRNLDGALKNIPGISGSTILGTGEPGMIIDLKKINKLYYEKHMQRGH